MVGSLPGCCPRAESGQANAVPPNADMNCRLPMPIVIRHVPNGIKPLQCGEGYHDPIGGSVTDDMVVGRRKAWPLFRSAGGCSWPLAAARVGDNSRSF